MSDTIKVNIPKELLNLTGMNIDNMDRKNLEILVLGLYAEGKMTLSMAANMLKVKIDEFLERFHELHYKKTGAPIHLKDAESDLQEAMQK